MSMMSCSFRGTRSTLETSIDSIVILRGRGSTSHVSHCVLYTPHSALYTPLSTLHPLYFTLHFTFHTSHSTIYTLHFTLKTLQSILYTPHSTLHTRHPHRKTWDSRLETSTLEHEKKHFVGDLLQFSYCVASNQLLRVVLWTSNFATSKSMFRTRLPSIFSTSHKMPAWSVRLPRKMTMDTPKVLRLPRKHIQSGYYTKQADPKHK